MSVFIHISVVFFHVDVTDMFYSIGILILYMHEKVTEYYNMINSKTTLGLMAIFAASVLVTGALVAAPSYASSGSHNGKSDKSGDGNTIVKHENDGKAIASGFGTEASNEQSNCITALFSGPCPDVTD